MTAFEYLLRIALEIIPTDMHFSKDKFCVTVAESTKAKQYIESIGFAMRTLGNTLLHFDQKLKIIPYFWFSFE